MYERIENGAHEAKSGFSEGKFTVGLINKLLFSEQIIS